MIRREHLTAWSGIASTGQWTDRKDEAFRTGRGKAAAVHSLSDWWLVFDAEVFQVILERHQPNGRTPLIYVFLILDRR